MKNYSDIHELRQLGFTVSMIKKIYKIFYGRYPQSGYEGYVTSGVINGHEARVYLQNNSGSLTARVWVSVN